MAFMGESPAAFERQKKNESEKFDGGPARAATNSRDLRLGGKYFYFFNPVFLRVAIIHCPGF